MQGLLRMLLPVVCLALLLAATPAFSIARIDPGEGQGACGADVWVEKDGATSFSLSTSEDLGCGTYTAFNLHLNRILSYPDVVNVRVSTSNDEAIVLFDLVTGGACWGTGSMDFQFDYRNMPITVWIAGTNDGILDGDQPYTVSVQNLSRNDPVCEPIINIPGINHDNSFKRLDVTVHSGHTTYRGGVTGTQIRPQCNYAGCLPTSNVDVILTTSDPAQGMLKTASDPTPRNQIVLTYTPANNQTYQWAYAVGMDDRIPNGDRPFTVSITTSSSDSRWNGMTDQLNVTNEGPSDAEMCIASVPGKFTTVPWQGQRLIIWDDLVPAGEYRSPACGNCSAQHFEGVARSPKGPYLFVTGRGQGSSHLFTVKVDKSGIPGRWGANFGGSNERFVWKGDIDPNFDHAGGLSLMGDFAAIPLEDPGFCFVGSGASKVVFYDVWDPLNPVPLPEVLFRGALHQAGAAAITKLQSGFFTTHYLLAVESDNPREIQFYLSNTVTIQSTSEVFPETPLSSWSTLQHGAPDYNSINFIQDCSGMLYMVGTYNTSSSGGGTNISDLYLVTPPNRTPGGQTILPDLSLVASVNHDCDGGDWCNFGAAAGAYAAASGELILYSTHYYRDMNGGEITQCDSEAPFHAMEF